MSGAARRVVECGTHGEQSPAYVCSHLLEGLRIRDIRSIGFHESEPEPEDSEPCGWCQACEEVRTAEGGWNDRSERHAKIKLVCTGCFEAIRQLASAPVS